jgi:hypothetical protein
VQLVDAGAKALKTERLTVSLATLAARTRQLDPAGKGVSETTIQRNPEARAIYELHRAAVGTRRIERSATASKGAAKVGGLANKPERDLVGRAGKQKRPLVAATDTAELKSALDQSYRERLRQALRIPGKESRQEEVDRIGAEAHQALKERFAEIEAFIPKLLHDIERDELRHMVLDENVFVEVVLPGSIMRKLSEDEMAVYRAPFRDREARLPTLVWPRELPIEGTPADVVQIVERYGNWLAGSEQLPKLFINADPGAQIVGRIREFCRRWPNQREVTVPGIHFIQEDSADQIGAAIREFVGNLRR